MRVVLALSCMLLSVSTADAVDWRASTTRQVKTLSRPGASDAREGGESWADALPIPGLPFSDSGATCDNHGDISESCQPTSGPDVVYRYTPAVSDTICVSLCGSDFDTVLGIFDGALNQLYCNDDFCGLQSQIQDVIVTAGQTYYFVVDGFDVNCGAYDFFAGGSCAPCSVSCPPGALHECEPDCYDGYFDTYNGGCNGGGFQVIVPQSGSSAVMCGKSGTYMYAGLSYRDTDWFEVHGTGGTMTASCEATFPLQLMFIYGTDCANPLYDYVTADPCQEIMLSRYVAACAKVWIWVGPSVFSGIPCGSDYVLSLDGIADCGAATPSAATSTVGCACQADPGGGASGQLPYKCTLCPGGDSPSEDIYVRVVVRGPSGWALPGSTVRAAVLPAGGASVRWCPEDSVQTAVSDCAGQATLVFQKGSVVPLNAASASLDFLVTAEGPGSGGPVQLHSCVPQLLVSSFDLEQTATPLSVLIQDSERFMDDLGGSEIRSDFDHDGAVDAADLGLMRRHLCHGCVMLRGDGK